MSYLSLYRKWRPGAFEEVLGQAHVTQTLVNAIREDRVSHAYLFSGPRGTGKTSTARILARALNCEEGVSPTPCGKCTPCREIAEGNSLDVFEMDAASHTSVDDVREIRERIPFASVSGGRKVYIIDEAHQLSGAAFNALLKMLEEPPGHVVFVLCTTESHKLPATVVSRCQRFEFRRLGPTELTEHLDSVAERESIEADVAALRAIARHARGSARDALSLLDQAAGTSEGRLSLDHVLEILGQTPEDVLLELGDAVATGDVLAAFKVVERMVEAGWDPRQLLVQTLEHLRSLFLARRGADELVESDDDHRGRLVEQAHRFEGAHLEWALRVLGEAQADVRWSQHPRLTLEVALARAARLEADDVGALRARIERLERMVVGGRSAQAVSAQPASAPAPSKQAPAKRAEPKRSESAEPPPAREEARLTPPKPDVREARAPAPAETPTPAEATQTSPPEQAAPEQPRVAAAGDPSLGGAWDRMLDLVRQKSRVTHTHLKDAWPVSADGGDLVIGFEKDFHADAIKQPKHASLIMAAVEQAFGSKLRLQPEVRPAGERPEEGGADDGPIGLVMRGLAAEVVEELEG